MNRIFAAVFVLFALNLSPGSARAWHDETHVAIAKAAGYAKWFNATGADMIKVKARQIEKTNHFVNNARGVVVTADLVMAQVKKYNRTGDPDGHLYGAIIASVRDFQEERQKGKYGHYHLAFAAHYIGDLSQPLHNTLYNRFNRKHHSRMDGIINHEVLRRSERIKIYAITIKSETDLAREIARIANLSMALGYKLEDEQRLITEAEAYRQISHSASLFKSVLQYVGQ